MIRARTLLIPALGALLVLATGAALWAVYLRPDLPPAERGRRLAENLGCFGCHGPEGSLGSPDPGREDGAVPGFGSELMMFASGPAEIRQWITDGVTRSRSKSISFNEQQDAATVVMPAFGRRLDPGQIDDLVVFVQAVNGAAAPADSLAGRGRKLAAGLGCFGCHGPGGRFARPNAGSLKGYVPSWDGADFAEVVRDRAEFEEWVRDGKSRRFTRNPLARRFLDRAVLHMPAYRDHLEAGDLDALWAYVSWLRTEGAAPTGR